ncbi:MORC family CW-type zinc finger 3-like protein [Labeo rohita]|uniref:MORC family CW-type zinc finger 3-like protein n=1 Tax=Labeo rohita TaxID=84645 RepID=A0A498M8U8_LABRO|nr:MORC family CW-type zinc finger 3-like protein [Labeo rohita]
MPGGSTKKICPFCQGILFCAQKVCSNCKKQQPVKQRLQKKLQQFDEKREQWVVGRKRNHNIASIKDEAIVMLEKLHAIGYKPVLLLGKETKKKKNKCEILTPRCTLSTYAKDFLQKIGWDQDSSGSDAELITLHLTPCDPLEGQEEQAIIMEGEEEQAIVTEGQEEQAEQATITEGPKEQMNEGPRHMPKRKKPQKNCSYHTGLEAFPIRSVVRERVRKGKAEILVDWEPCPICYYLV